MHVLIIPDGNRRYAKKKNIGIDKAYKIASEKTTSMLIDELLLKNGVDELSFYSISRENLIKRGRTELDRIFFAHINIYELWLKKNKFIENIKFNFLGDLSLLPQDYVDIIQKLEEKTKNNSNKICNILVGYSGKWDFLNTMKTLFESDNEIDELDENYFLSKMALKSNIDLIIRTGNDARISNAPLFQAAYAEFFFVDFFYPEFSPLIAKKLLKKFFSITRRFGK